MHNDSDAAPRQTALPIAASISQNDGIFYRSACNDAVAGAVRKAAEDSHFRAVRLIGPARSGKTRLLKTLAREMANAHYVCADAAPSCLRGDVTLHVLDRLDDAIDERRVFHYINSVRESGAALIVADRGERRFSLPDLASRLESFPCVFMPPPDAELLQTLLAERFAARQLRPSATVLRFIAGKIERDYAAPEKAVHALDAASLALGAPVTRALATSILPSLGKHISL
ncbi:MAG: hypothetical protein ABW189_09255 [Rickettsiales bacterium]